MLLLVAQVVGLGLVGFVGVLWLFLYTNADNRDAQMVMQTAVAAQNKLLSYFLKSSSSSSSSSQQPSPTRCLNYIELHRKPPVVAAAAGGGGENDPPKEERVLVMMHGYGLGLGFFFANYDHLLPHFDRIIAVDWQGMGASPRGDAVHAKASTGGFIASLLQTTVFSSGAEERELEKSSRVTNEFIDSLERFRTEHGLKSFILAGHSLGGFLSANYALKYPSVVRGLVLISPVGIPPKPPKETWANTSEVGWRFRLFQGLWGLTLPIHTIHTLYTLYTPIHTIHPYTHYTPLYTLYTPIHTILPYTHYIPLYTLYTPIHTIHPVHTIHPLYTLYTPYTPYTPLYTPIHTIDPYKPYTPL